MGYLPSVYEMHMPGIGWKAAYRVLLPGLLMGIMNRSVDVAFVVNERGRTLS